jgi:hypothetical protein
MPSTAGGETGPTASRDEPLVGAILEATEEFERPLGLAELEVDPGHPPVHLLETGLELESAREVRPRGLRILTESRASEGTLQHPRRPEGILGALLVEARDPAGECASLRLRVAASSAQHDQLFVQRGSGLGLDGGETAAQAILGFLPQLELFVRVRELCPCRLLVPRVAAGEQRALEL